MIANLKARVQGETLVGQVAHTLDQAFGKYPPATIGKSITLADLANHTPAEMMDASQGEKGYKKISQASKDKEKKVWLQKSQQNKT